jgi:hypothetical protein
MKIEIRKTKQDGIVQITTLDERWYSKDDKDGPRFNPSITWIAHHSPMGLGLLKFYAQHGWDEAQAIKNAAAEKGSKVHQACEFLLLGNTVRLDSRFRNPETGNDEELTPEEYWHLMTFEDWWKNLTSEHEVELVDTEMVAWVEPEKGEQYGYAGTRDIKLRIDGKPVIYDIKTSQDIYLPHELQLSALKHADPELPETRILRIGYRRNQRGWIDSEVQDKFDLFLSAKKFWADENPDTKPKQKDYPPELLLTIPEKKLPPAPVKKSRKKPSAPKKRAAKKVASSKTTVRI